MAEDNRQNLFENLFGFALKSPKEEAEKKIVKSPFPPIEDDGGLMIADGVGAYSATFLDYGKMVQNEQELITKYRSMALHPVVEKAIDNILNDMISFDSQEDLVEIDCEEVPELSENTRLIIREEFEKILDMLKFRKQGYNILKKWYVDGRLYFHMVIDNEKPQNGIVEIRYIDPRKIKLIKKERKSATVNTLVRMHERFEEFFLYNPNAVTAIEAGFKIAKDSIAYCHSGILDETGMIVLSNLHKGMKILNQMKWMEDALVIYRLVRSAERRVFTIDVGDIPPAKAKAYIEGIMNQHKNKIHYDPSTGQVDTDKRYLTMLDDFYLPQRDGKGTSVTQLSGGANLSDIEDVNYFRRLLYEALNVPATRLEKETLFSSGRTSEITRDEVNYQKFIDRQRIAFSNLFLAILRVQLVLKGICSLDEWKKWEAVIRFDYQVDNFFTQFKDLEILQAKLQVLTEIDPFVQKYFSSKYVKKKVLHQDDDEIEQLEMERDEDEQTGEAAKFMGAGDPFGMDPMGGGMGGPPGMDPMGGMGPPPPGMDGMDDPNAQMMPPDPNAGMPKKPKKPGVPRKNKSHPQPPKGPGGGKFFESTEKKPVLSEMRRAMRTPKTLTEDAKKLARVLTDHADLSRCEYVTLSTPLRPK